jgi:hypothetical protein
MGMLSWFGGRRRDAPEPEPAPESAPPPPAASTPGWREVPPLQRTVGSQDLVVDPDGFRGLLGTWRDASFSRPLGHLVSPEAPSGLAHGLAEPSPVPAQAPSPGPTPVTRHFPAPGGTPPPVAVPVQRAVAETPSPSPSLPLTSARPAETQVRQLMPVRRVSAPARRQVERAGEVAEAPRPPHGFGLGEPLAGLPPTAQREPAARAATSPLPEATPDPGPVPEPQPQPELPGEPEAVEPPSRPLLGEDPLVAEPAAPQSPVPPQPVHPVQRAAASAEPAPPPGVPARGDGPVVPLVAQRTLPLFSRVASPPIEDSPPEPAPPVVPVRWEAPSAPPPVQRTAAVPGAAVSQSPTPPSWRPSPPPPSPHPSPLPPLQRAVTTPPPRPADGLVDAGAVAVASGVARRMADGSVVFRAPSAAPSVQPQLQLQRQVETAGIPEPEPEAEPSAEPPSGMETTIESDPASVAASVPPAAGQDSQEGQGGAPKVNDELVRALFAPLSRLLRAELRLERERAGFLINTRH